MGVAGHWLQIALNLGGALLTGIALGVEEHEDSDITQRRIANLFRGGFIGVFTNLAWSLEQAFEVASGKADQAPFVTGLLSSQVSSLMLNSWHAQAICFVVGLFCLGVATNFIGYHIGANVFGPLSDIHGAVTSPRGGRLRVHAGVKGSLARFLPPLMAAYILSCLSQALYEGRYEGRYGLWKDLTTGLMYVCPQVSSPRLVLSD